MDDAISLGVGEPDFVTPWSIRDAAIRSVQRGLTQYTGNRGLPELRKNICRYLESRFGVHADPEHTIVTVGASEASAVLPPSGGEAREEELLTAFARLRILRTRSFNTFLEELRALSGLDMIVLSPYDSEALQVRLEALRARGNTVRLFVVEGGAA